MDSFKPLFFLININQTKRSYAPYECFHLNF